MGAPRSRDSSARAASAASRGRNNVLVATAHGSAGASRFGCLEIRAEQGPWRRRRDARIQRRQVCVGHRSRAERGSSTRGSHLGLVTAQGSECFVGHQPGRRSAAAFAAGLKAAVPGIILVCQAPSWASFIGQGDRWIGRRLPGHTSTGLLCGKELDIGGVRLKDSARQQVQRGQVCDKRGGVWMRRWFGLAAIRAPCFGIRGRGGGAGGCARRADQCAHQLPSPAGPSAPLKTECAVLSQRRRPCDRPFRRKESG